MVLPLFPLTDADELVCMPQLHSAVSALAVLEMDPGVEGAPVALPAGLETDANGGERPSRESEEGPCGIGGFQYAGGQFLVHPYACPCMPGIAITRFTGVGKIRAGCGWAVAC